MSTTSTAHGTGTLLGDAIEADALGDVLGQGRTAERPLLIGSVKSNLGHLEGAAGIVDLIKTVLSLDHCQLPATLHFQRPNPHIDFTALGLRLVTAPTPWPTARPAGSGRGVRLRLRRHQRTRRLGTGATAGHDSEFRERDRAPRSR
ncbi:hypothetical protein ACF05L_22570 [Streptomyces bobili]|uniref:hypothetical protein n=1 Tax=Streptomyces bobili TaxID=67280 RepID=UPI00370020C6